MKEFENTIESILGEAMIPKKVKVVLELNAAAVKKIERLAEQDIKSLLEDEINNVDAFIDTMGYDNW